MTIKQISGKKYPKKKYSKKLDFQLNILSKTVDGFLKKKKI